MNSDASGTVVGFSDPPNVPETALFSFNPLVYLYFMLSFFFVPYPLYRYVAHRYNWELNVKTGARHWSDIMFGCSYGVILFVFGNYSHCYSWITVVAFYPSLFGYGWIAELPFTKTSLPNIRNWPKGMWIVFLTAVGIILAFAAFHIYLASTLTLPFVAYYVCGLLIPLFFMIMAVLLIKEVNNNWLRTKYHQWALSRYQKRRPQQQQQQQQQQQDEKTQQENGDTNASGGESPALPAHGDTNPSASSPDLEANQPILNNPYTSRISLHLHHWQIFYMLAFFTRFTHPVSQVASGIVLACYMEGICAYGYDHLVNDD